MHRIRESNSIPRAKLADRADRSGSRGLLLGPPRKPLARRRTDVGRCRADPFPLSRGADENSTQATTTEDAATPHEAFGFGGQSRDRLRWIACQPFDARARSQPTRALQSPLTRPRAFGTNTDGRTTPRECMAAREQVEASEGVDSSPLGMHTITRDVKPTSEGPRSFTGHDHPPSTYQAVGRGCLCNASWLGGHRCSMPASGG